MDHLCSVFPLSEQRLHRFPVTENHFRRGMIRVRIVGARRSGADAQRAFDQPPEQVGSASAIVNFMYTVLGAVGTVVMTLPWASYVEGLAIVMGACSLLMLLLFCWGLRK